MSPLFSLWWQLLKPVTFCWGSGAVGNCERIHGYDRAARYFEETKQPRGRRWGMEERPLYNNRSNHYRIERIDEGAAFDLVLYSTSMVRYLRPLADGTHAVWLRGDSHNASSAFLHNQGWSTWWRGVRAGESDLVKVPLSYYCRVPYEASNGVVVPERWSAVLVFDASPEGNGQLLLDRSAHREVFVKRSSEEDSAKRRMLKNNMETLVDLMVLRIPEFHAQGEFDYARARPFRSGRTPKLSARTFKGAEREGWTFPQESTEALIAYAQETYNVLVSKTNWDQISHTTASAGTLPSATQEQFRASLTRALLDVSGFAQQSSRVALPQFPKELPRRYFF